MNLLDAQLNQRFQEGVAYLNANNIAAAYQIFKDIIRTQRNFLTLNAYAISSHLLGLHHEAIHSINLAIDLEPNNVEGYKNKIEFLKPQAKYTEIIQCANELALIGSNEEELSLFKAEVYSKINKPFYALKEYQRVIKINYPDQAASIDQLNGQDTLYHLENLRKRKTPYLDYPMHVAFETYAMCNAKCTFCVYPDLERQGEMMSMSLIDKIIADLEEIPKDVGFQLSPFGVNEPFLDKRIFSILEKISTKLPNASITLTSNAIPLNKINLDKLLHFKLGYLWLSVVDHRKEVYEEKMKISYDKMLKNLHMIHNLKETGNFTARVVISRLLDHSENDDHFIAFFKDKFPLFETCLWPYTNWLGKTSNPITSDIADIPCSHWFEFRISSSGLVQHCCMDGHVDFPWGDVNKKSILEIYNQPNYRNLRLNTYSRRTVEPCNSCNLR
ncbi:MAG: radical SAM protein [Betaproteobacteria bacterium]